jgi:hypothetical protein
MFMAWRLVKHRDNFAFTFKNLLGYKLFHRVQNGSGAHPASYPQGTRGSFPGGKTDHSPPSSAEFKEWVELYLHSPNPPSWRGARLKHRDNFTFTFYL